MVKHLYYYTPLDRPFPTVAGRLLDDPGLWLPDPAARCGDEFEVLLRAEHALPSALERRSAVVTVGPAVEASGGLLRSVTWRASGMDQLFPVLDADLELAPLGEHASQLSLMGTYRPPLSVVGGAADALVGHRVAQACVRSFIESIARKVSVATLPV